MKSAARVAEHLREVTAAIDRLQNLRQGAPQIAAEKGTILTSLPEIIDRETGAREVLDILENIISEAGDLIETRSPELVAAARAALRRYSDETARQAE